MQLDSNSGAFRHRAYFLHCMLRKEGGEEEWKWMDCSLPYLRAFSLNKTNWTTVRPSKTLVELGSVCGQFLTVYNIVHHIIYKLIHVYLRDCWEVCSWNLKRSFSHFLFYSLLKLFLQYWFYPVSFILIDFPLPLSDRVHDLVASLHFVNLLSAYFKIS